MTKIVTIPLNCDSLEYTHPDDEISFNVLPRSSSTFVLSSSSVDEEDLPSPSFNFFSVCLACFVYV